MSMLHLAVLFNESVGDGVFFFIVFAFICCPWISGKQFFPFFFRMIEVAKIIILIWIIIC